MAEADTLFEISAGRTSTRGNSRVLAAFAVRQGSSNLNPSGRAIRILHRAAGEYAWNKPCSKDGNAFNRESACFMIS